MRRRDNRRRRTGRLELSSTTTSTVRLELDLGVEADTDLVGAEGLDRLVVEQLVTVDLDARLLSTASTSRSG